MKKSIVHLVITLFSSITLLTCSFLGVVSSVYAATVIFQEDFEAYAPGSNLAGQGGWQGDAMVVGNATFLGTNPNNVLDGRATIPPNGNKVTNHSIGSLNTGTITALTADAYATFSASPDTHAHRLGISSQALSSSSGIAGVYWEPEGIFPRSPGWDFQLHPLIGTTANDTFIPGGYDMPITLSIVIDSSANEIYGTYDFGTGLMETPHISVAAEKIALLDAVEFNLNHESPTSFLGGEYDNLTVTQVNAVPTPAAVWLFGSGLMGLLGLASGNKRRQRKG